MTRVMVGITVGDIVQFAMIRNEWEGRYGKNISNSRAEAVTELADGSLVVVFSYLNHLSGKDADEINEALTEALKAVEPKVCRKKALKSEPRAICYNGALTPKVQKGFHEWVKRWGKKISIPPLTSHAGTLIFLYINHLGKRGNGPKIDREIEAILKQKKKGRNRL